MYTRVFVVTIYSPEILITQKWLFSLRIVGGGGDLEMLAGYNRKQ
jgi:hypothetical protein